MEFKKGDYVRVKMSSKEYGGLGYGMIGKIQDIWPYHWTLVGLGNYGVDFGGPKNPNANTGLHYFPAEDLERVDPICGVSGMRGDI